MLSLGKQGRRINYMDIDFLRFRCVVGVCQEGEDKANVGKMRLADSILETSFYEL